MGKNVRIKWKKRRKSRKKQKIKPKSQEKVKILKNNFKIMIHFLTND